MKKRTKRIIHSTLVTITVLISLSVIGAFWETEYNPLQTFSSQKFPLGQALRLGKIVEIELARSGVLNITTHRNTVRQDVLTWTTYEYVVKLERVSLFADIAHALAESIPANGGQIFQTYFRSRERKASIVAGVDSFITHTIVLTWEALKPVVKATPPPEPVKTAAHFRAAIVIDDLGASEQVVYRLLELGEDFTFSVLPHLQKSTEIATLLHERRKEILLHLPMEPRGHEYPGKGAIMTNMGPDTIRQVIEQDLQTVPYAVGANNHMGSRLTADPQAMQMVLQTLQDHQLFFLDSRTSSKTVAYKTAQQLGLKSAKRKVFLDVIPQYDFVKAQLLELASLAEQGQAAIAIGHPKEATFRALKAILPEFERRNIKIVRLSEFVK